MWKMSSKWTSIQVGIFILLLSLFTLNIEMTSQVSFLLHANSWSVFNPRGQTLNVGKVCLLRILPREMKNDKF